VTGGATSELDKLFSSSEALAGATILANDSAGKFAGTLELMATRTGIVKENYDKMVSGFAASNQLLANNMRAALVEIGKPLLDEYNDIAGAVSSIFNELGLSVKGGGLKVLSDALESFVQDAVKSIQGVAAALPEALELLDFSNLLSSFERLGDEFGGIFDELFGAGLDLSKPEDLAVALQRGVDLATTLVNVTKGIVQEFKPLFEIISLAIDEVGSASSENSEKIGSFLGTLTLIDSIGTKAVIVLKAMEASSLPISTAFEFISGTIEALALGFENFALLLTRLFIKIEIGINDLQKLNPFGDFAEKAEERGVVLQGAFDNATNAIADNARKILTVYDGVGDKAEETAQRQANSAKEAADGVIESTADFTTRSKSDIDAWQKGLKGKFLEVTEDTKKLAEEFSTNSPSFDIISTFDPTEFDSFNTKVNELRESGSKFFQEWKDGIGGEITEYGGSKALDDAREKLDIVGESFDDLELTQEDFNKQNGITAESLKEVAKAEVEVTDKTKELTESQKIAIDHTFELQKTLLEVASDERIANMEFSASIQVAEIQAQAQQIEAAFESLSVTVASTSETVASMFDTLASAYANSDVSTWDTWELEDRLDKQEELQEKAIEAQISLAEAEEEKLRAETELIEKGESGVTITYEGGDPIVDLLLEDIASKLRIRQIGEGLGVVT